VLAVSALVAVYFLVTAALTAIRSHQLGEQEAQLRAEIEVLQSRYERLQALRQYLDSDEYIEAVAREQLGLVRPDETAFVVISTVPTPEPEEGEVESELWWDVLIR
jgi:cell division protein FtsB